VAADPAAHRTAAAAQPTELSRDLGVFTITMVGVGAMIGAGIFVLTGIAAGTAGPALILAFAANGIVTFLTALAYAELGSAIPEAGGGYLWVKEGLPGPNAFLAGWMSWFAHAVAGSLYALGFGAYLGLVLEEAGVTLLGFTGPMLEKPFAVVIAVAFIGINFKGVSETGLAGNVVTVAKILVILLFIGSGLYAMFGDPGSWDNFTPFAPEGLGGVLTAMGLTYVAFEGYEIIVQAGEEVRDPKRNIPRAIFWSLAIVIPIYILVAVTALGAVNTGTGQPTWQWLGQHKELGLAEAARQFMPFGTTLLLVGGLLSTISALNATTFSSTRVSFAMGRDRNLPDFFARIHAGTRTPYLALLASGSLIIFMALALPIEDVAAAADVMFLLLFLQVNVAIVTIRRKYGEKLDYGFLIPFFPALPILAITLMIGIAGFMFRFSPVAWFFVIGWVGTGFVIYYTYARRRERGKRATPVVLRERQPRAGYRVLVPVANPSRAGALIRFGAMVARANDGEVVLLHVITVPRQTPLEIGRRFIREAYSEVLDQATAAVEAEGIRSSSIVRVAHKPAEATIHEVEDSDIDMVVLGWRGESRHPRTALGTNIDWIMRVAPADVVVLRADDLDRVDRVLIPVADPDQGHDMIELGVLFETQAASHVDLLHVLPPGLGVRDRRERLDELYDGLEDLGVGPPGTDPVRSLRIVEDPDPVDAIVRAASDYDLTVVGAAREGPLHRLVLGNRPEQVARRCPGRLLLYKNRRNPVHSVVLDTLDFFRTGEPGPGGAESTESDVAAEGP
jgi:amino acid transporter/nucleotide-binding universal stress UspA family protein